MQKNKKTLKKTKIKKTESKAKRAEIIYVEQVLAELFDCEIVPEYRFDKFRRFRFDYAIERDMLGIEIEGGVYTQGRHTRGAGYSRDIEKYNLAQLLGWSVYRFTYQQIKSGYFFETINELLKK